MDNHRIDSHKLIFHPQRVADWQAGAEIYPIYAEISPSGACNHRCTFCALDYMEYRPRFLPTDLLCERLTELAQLGLKSLMLGGEGEPLLHRDCAKIVTHARSQGIDVAITTNGVLLDRSFAERTVQSLSWIKVSINAGTAETYARIHRAKADDFEMVIANLATTVEVAKSAGSPCTIGAQMILLPENAGEAADLAARCRDAGLAYLVIKPYSQHLMSHTRTYREIDYGGYLSLAEQLETYATDSFRVIFRRNTMRKLNRNERGYGRCQALPFWTYIDSGGNVWGCSAWLGDERFLYGNIDERGFSDIWTGERRRKNLEWMACNLDPAECRQNCRMDEINRYLWELTHPGAHVNFI